MAGAGFIARRHLGNLMSFPDVAVAGIADVNGDRARELAERCGARAYQSHTELLERERLDALYICVPPFVHGPVERDALALDLPLFIEKPLALDLATAEDIAADIAARDVITATGYHWRYLDIVECAAELLAKSRPHLALGYWLDELPPVPWWSEQRCSGGQMLEQTTHIFDLARLLVGEVESIRADAARIPPSSRRDCDIASVSTATLRFANGALGTISSTCLLPSAHRIGLHLFGDRLIAELSEFELLVDSGRGRVVRRAVADPFLAEDRDFIEAARGGTNRIRVPYSEALKSHRVAVAASRAAHDGTCVTFSDGRHE
jgi:predicted dehydrogenase